MLNIKTDVSIFWFRRDLRLEDNVGLFHALQSGVKILPLFIFDTDILNQLEDKADKRVDLIHQIVSSLQSDLERHDSTLVVKHGKPLEVFQQLCVEYNIVSVFTNRDYEPAAIERDNAVSAFLKSQQISFYSFKDQVVFEWNEVLKADGLPYTVYTPYSKVWKKLISETEIKIHTTEKLLSNLAKTEHLPIPNLSEIGFLPTGIKYSKPEVREKIIQFYDKTRDIPADSEGTSSLSVPLRFGTVSIRRLALIALRNNETWLNELIWREFFMQILMHFPYVTKGAFKPQYDLIKWRNNEAEFKCWCEGKTGYPIVDAGMRQLNQTGLMHNRVRMIVASFLTKDLLIDWRWGEAYFAQKLLDYDLAANNGNWQWAAGCGCDAAPYFRIFNPAEQTKRFDPEFTYINRWVTDINSFEYPAPIVDHSFARNRTLNTFKAALKSEL